MGWEELAKSRRRSTAQFPMFRLQISFLAIQAMLPKTSETRPQEFGMVINRWWERSLSCSGETTRLNFLPKPRDRRALQFFQFGFHRFLPDRPLPSALGALPKTSHWEEAIFLNHNKLTRALGLRKWLARVMRKWVLGAVMQQLGLRQKVWEKTCRQHQRANNFCQCPLTGEKL